VGCVADSRRDGGTESFVTHFAPATPEGRGGGLVVAHRRISGVSEICWLQPGFAHFRPVAPTQIPETCAVTRQGLYRGDQAEGTVLREPGRAQWVPPAGPRPSRHATAPDTGRHKSPRCTWSSAAVGRLQPTGRRQRSTLSGQRNQARAGFVGSARWGGARWGRQRAESKSGLTMFSGRRPARRSAIC